MISFLFALAVLATPPSPHPTVSPSLRFDSAIRACSAADGLTWAWNDDRATGVTHSGARQMDLCVNGARLMRLSASGVDLSGSVTINGAPIGGVSGGGTLNQLALWSGATALTGNATLTYDGSLFMLGATSNDTGRTPFAIVESSPSFGVTNETFIVRANSTTFDSSQIVTQNSSGAELRLGVGGPSTAGTFWGANRAGLATLNASGAVLFGVGTNGAQEMFFATNATEVARFNTTGQFFIGAKTNNTSRTTRLFVDDSDGTAFSFVGRNSAAGNGAFVDLMNDTGDDTFFGVTGSTAFSLFGTTPTKTFVIAGRAPNGMIVGTTTANEVSLASNGTKRQRILSDGSNIHVPQTLPTCSATNEWAQVADVASGVSTAHRSRMCMCTSNGSATYAWQNMVSATVGTATTCSD